MATSYGSITIVDITDIGEFSLYPTSNMPLSVIYNPDDMAYTPHWGSLSSGNLVLTPHLFYAGEPLSPTGTGVTVLWKKQVGSNTEQDISSTSGESVTNGILTVSQNQFNDSVSLVTYKVYGTYIEPDTNTTLTAVGQITFSLIKNAATVKSCKIIGESIFKYGADQTTVTPGSITLTAQLSNTVTNGYWQYLDSNGNYQNLPGYSTRAINANGSTVTIWAAETGLFNNNVATIKKLTSDNNTYDIITLTKLYDGVAGDTNTVLALTNDNQMIPCDSEGVPTIALTTITTEANVYEGSDVATGWTITVTNPTGIRGSFSNGIYTLQEWTTSSEAVSITFTATKTNSAPLTKVLTLAKIKTGTNGQSPEYYELITPTVVTNRNIGGSFSPSTVTFQANHIIGNTKTAYKGYLVLKLINTAGTLTTIDLGNMNDATPPSKDYTFADPTANTTLASIQVALYQTGGGGDVLDTQTIVVTDDGQTGAQGEPSYAVTSGNPHENVVCDSNGNAKTAQSILIPFVCWKGTSQVAGTVSGTPTGVPTGMSIGTITPCSTTTAGSIPITVTSGSNLGGADAGEITFTFSIEGKSIPMKFSWNKTYAGAKGADAIVFQCFAPNGDIIENKTNNVELNTLLLEGPTPKTATSYQWAKFNGSTYANISGATSSSYIVEPDIVEGYAAFRCTATYSGTSYDAYIAVRDKTDPLQTEVFSSIGQQIINGNGYGAVYARVFLNGEEVDDMLTTEFVTSTGDAVTTRCYLLNTTDKSLNYKIKSGNTWINGTENYEYTYTWTFRDINGNATTFNGHSSITGKVIYVDGSLIDKKIIFDVEVSKDN